LDENAIKKISHGVQGCQMVSFKTKNLNLGKFWRILDWKMLIYFMAIWNILHTFGIFYDHLVHFVFIWYTFSCFGIVYLEKSGNPDGVEEAVRRSVTVQTYVASRVLRPVLKNVE
jgi:hypothetical protein